MTVILFDMMHDRTIRVREERFLCQIFNDPGLFMRYQKVDDIIEKIEYKHVMMETYSPSCPEAHLDEVRNLLEAVICFPRRSSKCLASERQTSFISFIGSDIN
jgi:hypothetical protein